MSEYEQIAVIKSRTSLLRSGIAAHELALKMEQLSKRVSDLPGDRTDVLCLSHIAHLLCWLLVASADQNWAVRTPASVSCSLPIPQRKSTISSIQARSKSQLVAENAFL